MDAIAPSRLPAWLPWLPPLLGLVVCFLPLLTISGPLHEPVRISVAGLVRQAGSGGGEEKSERPTAGLERRAMDGLKRELSGLQVPVRGPVVLGLAGLCLLAHLVLSVVVLVRHLRGGSPTIACAVGLGLGLLASLLLLLGAALTQQGLNEVDGGGLAHKLAALVASAAASVWTVAMGAGGWVLGGCAAALLAAQAALRRRAA